MELHNGEMGWISYFRWTSVGLILGDLYFSLVDLALAVDYLACRSQLILK